MVVSKGERDKLGAVPTGRGEEAMRRLGDFVHAVNARVVGREREDEVHEGVLDPVNDLNAAEVIRLESQGPEDTKGQ